MTERHTHAFRLLIRGGGLTPQRMDALFAAGCGDATFGERDGVPFAEFDREARNLAAAVGTAIRDVERAVPGWRVVRVEPDDLVSAAAIAQRTQRTRESIRLLSEGRRGPGEFPSPVAWVNERTKLWRWADVAHWFRDRLGQDVGGPPSPAFLAALNAALELRFRAPELRRNPERTEIEWVLRESRLTG